MSRGRRATLVVVAALGVLAGAVLTLVLTDPTEEAGGTAASDAVGSARESVTSAATTDPGRPSSVEPSPAASTTLLAWVSGGLPADLASGAASLDVVERVADVWGDQIAMVRSARSDGTVVDDVEPGWAIPLDVIAVDPVTFATFVDPAARAAVRSLTPGTALVTQSSLELRQLDVGSTIELRGGPVEIVAVVDDISGAGAELVVHRSDADRLGVATPRYLLVAHEPGQRETATRAIADLAGSVSVRFRTPAETTWLRHGDAVVPQVFVKAAFGEFAFRDGAGRSVEIDPAWVDRHIVDAEVPILGSVRCHRKIVEPLRQALGALADDNLSHLVDPAGYAGCWSPRRISAGQPLSRHAWGIAVDLNIEGNPRGSFSTQDARLVEALRDAGFTWGGLWLVPDPGHYELVPPT